MPRSLPFRAALLLCLSPAACSLDRAGQASIGGPGLNQDGDPASVDDAGVDATGADGAPDQPGDGADGSPADGGGDGDGDADLPPGEVAVFRTGADGSRVLAQDDSLRFVDGAPDAALVIEVDPARRYQAIDGFGAQVHEAAASVLTNRVDGNERRTVLRRLFDREAGAGLSVLRMPIGSSNYAYGPYSYDETAPDLSDFSIEREERELVPLLRDARALQPDLLLFAAPWSPPPWMKTGRSMNGGLVAERYYPELANYLANFVEAYAGHGLSVYALSPQNEPYNAPQGIDYPATLMPAEAQADFIVDHLAPTFAARELGTKLLTWDHNWDDAEAYTNQVLGREDAKALVAGTALHCYLGDVSVQAKLHELHPDEDLWLTECESDGRVSGFEAELNHAMELSVSVLSNWSRTVMLGSLALDPGHGPRVGGCTDCGSLVRVQADESLVLSGELAALGHFGKFVDRAAQRIASNVRGTAANDLAHVAFVNPDGSRVLVVYNRSSSVQAFSVRQGTGSLRSELAPRSAVTFHWSRTRGAVRLSGVTTSASSSASNMPTASAIDGDLDTRWSAGFPQGGEQWYALDFGTPVSFSSLTLDAGENFYDYPRSFRVQVSDDGSAFRDVAALEGDAGLMTVRFAPTVSRHVRIVSTGVSGYWWSIAELGLGL